MGVVSTRGVGFEYQGTGVIPFRRCVKVLKDLIGVGLE